MFNPKTPKKISKTKAKKAKECFFCNTSWEEGEEMFIISDALAGSFELACVPCGEAFMRDKTFASTNPSREACDQIEELLESNFIERSEPTNCVALSSKSFEKSKANFEEEVLRLLREIANALKAEF